MSYKVKEEDIHVVHANKLSDSKKDSFSYNMRRTEKGWIIYYDHFNIDSGLISSDRLFLPDEVVDILTTYQAKKKLDE